VIITGRRVWLVIAFALFVRFPVIAFLTLAFVGRWRCRRLASFFW
jgi:hypothetical protein